jgi:hypothetical protein
MHSDCSTISRAGSSISIPAPPRCARAEEKLTVMRRGCPENLERVLSSTNWIEKLFSRLREIGGRVKTLPDRHHGAASDRGPCARSRARLPQARRLSSGSDPVAALSACDAPTRSC